MPEILTPDIRDVFYVVGGAAFFGMTFLPILKPARFVSVPTLYVGLGALLGLSPLAMPFVDPREGGLQLDIVERVSELIVIVSLAGAGLAVDRRMGLRSWASTWRLLFVAMPLTILAIAWLAGAMLALPLATALLLAAVLAPTDPVLARSVQVHAPNEDEHEVQVALTAEAGLNDGLAFPFVYLAMGVAALGAGASLGEYARDGLFEWLWFDLVYKLGIAVVVGILVGRAVSRVVYSPIGDAQRDGANAGLTLMGATFLGYGLTELVSGYGFLAVFVSARAARHYARTHRKEGYEAQPHHFADQFEGLMTALLLLWFGQFLVQGLLSDSTLAEWGFALVLVLIVRPAAGYLALLGHDCPKLDKLVIAFFGIRGMGSIFYLAYALNHAEFPGAEAAWRVMALVILTSIVVHGATSSTLVERVIEGGRRRREAASPAPA